MSFHKASELARQRAAEIGLEFIGPYHGSMTKTAYLCQKHGEFLQTPNKVQQRLGCQKCGRIQQGVARKLTDERLAEDAANVGLIFNGGFRTTQVTADYVCPVHGPLRLRPASVVAGRGCQECGRIAGGLKRRKLQPSAPKASRKPPKVTLEQLKDQAAAVGLRYADVYVPSSKLAQYVCEAHGEIEMYPAVVRRGAGCRFCAGNAPKPEAQLTAEALQIGLRYIGPYKGDRSSTAYECPKHGVIQKAPGDVKSGRRCRHCVVTGLDTIAPAVFYVYRVERIIEPDFIGYGLSKRHGVRHTTHMATFRVARATGELIATYDLPSGRDAADLERHLQRVLSNVHIKTDLPGFKKEAIAVEAEPEVLSTIAEWLSARRAEERSAA